MTLAGQRVLLVYGLLGEVAQAFRPFGLEYMQPLAEWLRLNDTSRVAFARRIGVSAATIPSSATATAPGCRARWRS